MSCVAFLWSKMVAPEYEGSFKQEMELHVTMAHGIFVFKESVRYHILNI